MHESRGTVLTRYAPRVVASAFFVLGLSYLALGREYPVMQHDQAGPGLYPLLVGLFWVAAAAVSLVDVFRSETRERENVRWPDRVGWARIGAVLATTVVYVFLTPLLGDVVVGFVVLLIVMRAMGMRRLLWLVPIAAVMAILWHVVFVVALGVPLPQGIWDR